jgi:hypothetical protein
MAAGGTCLTLARCPEVRAVGGPSRSAEVEALLALADPYIEMPEGELAGPLPVSPS